MARNRLTSRTLNIHFPDVKDPVALDEYIRESWRILKKEHESRNDEFYSLVVREDNSNPSVGDPDIVTGVCTIVVPNGTLTDEGDGQVFLDFAEITSEASKKVAVDSLSEPDFLGTTDSIGVLRSTTPLTYIDGGDWVTLGIQVANTSQNGYLTSTDWNTFNDKVDSIPDHNDLSGLNAGDFLHLTALEYADAIEVGDGSQFLLLDGTRDMTGNLHGVSNFKVISDSGFVNLISNGTYVHIQSAVDNDMFFDCGSLFQFRDEDDGGAVRFTIDSANGDIVSTGDATAVNFIGNVQTPSQPDIDHNSLDNLAVGDVHSQYLFLDGRGGQTIYDTITITGSNPSISEVALDMANNDIDNVNSIQLNLTPIVNPLEGMIWWNEEDGCPNVRMAGSGGVVGQIPLENFVRVVNKTGITIVNGAVVYINGSQGGRATVGLADKTDSDTIHIAGIATETIINNQNGWITINGEIRDIDTTGTPVGETWVADDKLYLSTAGTLSNIHPSSAVEAVVIVATVTVAHATEGKILLTAPEAFTLGNNFDGTLRQSIINKNGGTSAAVGFTAVNDLNHFTTMGLACSGNTTFPNEVSIHYAPGYGDHWQAVDGAKDFVWFTDPTDSHNNSSLNYERMRLDSDGKLFIHNMDLVNNDKLLVWNSLTGKINYRPDPSVALNEPTGFPNKTDSTIWIDDNPSTDNPSVPGRFFTISPVGDSYSIWQQGVEYIIDEDKTFEIEDTSGYTYIFFDEGVLTGIRNPSHEQTDDIFINKVAVSLVYWNSNTQEVVIFGEERHGTIMDGKEHEYHHDIDGARFESGFTTNDYILDTASDAALTFTVVNGRMYDEDIDLDIIDDGVGSDPYTQILNTSDAEIPVMYRDDIDGSWKQFPASTLPYILDTDLGAGVGGLTYNLDDGDGTFSQELLGLQKFMTYTLVCTNDRVDPVKMIQGQVSYNSKNDALEGAATEIINFGEFPTTEQILLYRFIMQRVVTGGTKNAKIIEVTDFRTSTLSGSSAVATSHGSLSGLSNDDHSQYWANTTVGVRTNSYSTTGDVTLSDAGHIVIDTTAINGAIDASNDSNDCIIGKSVDANGVRGNTTNGIGVRGQSSGGNGVKGVSVSSIGVSGDSTSDIGVRGESVTKQAGLFYRNTASETTPVVEIIQNNANDTDDILRLTHDSSEVFAVDWQGGVQCQYVEAVEFVAADEIEANLVDSLTFSDGTTTITGGDYSGVNNIDMVGDLSILSDSSKLFLGENQNSSIYFDGTDLNIGVENPSVGGTIKLNDDVSILGDLIMPTTDSKIDMSGNTPSANLTSLVKLSTNCLGNGECSGFTKFPDGNARLVMANDSTPNVCIFLGRSTVDTTGRLIIDRDGKHSWGIGSGSPAFLTSLEYDPTVQGLKISGTHDNLDVGGDLDVTGSIAGASLAIDNISINGSSVSSVSGDLSLDGGSDGVTIDAESDITLTSNSGDIYLDANSVILTNPLGVTSGGTGLASLTGHGLLLGRGTGNVNMLAPDASTTKVLTSGGASADPTWETPSPGSPTTTQGDMIFRGSAVDERLAATTNGYVLTLAAGEPAWAAPTGISGTGEAWDTDGTVTTRVIETDGITINTLADVVGTLIEDLIAVGLLDQL